MADHGNSAQQYLQKNNTWNPIQVAKHYDIPVDNLTGKGQKVAIMALGQPPPEDVLQQLIDLASNKRYKGKFNVLQLPGDLPVRNWKPITTTGEYAMDAQIVGTLCPEADITIIVGAESFQGMADVIDKAVQLGCSVLTSSVGFPEEYLGKYSNTTREGAKAVEDALTRAADAKMTVFVASGDSGSGRRIANHAVATDLVSVSVPATQPGVVCCGGTEIRKEDGASVETTWNNSDLHLDNPYGAAGAGTGGVSRRQPLPSWQNAHSHITHANTGKTGRIVPDVSAVASFVEWDIWESGKNGTGGEWSTGDSPSGGTSAVAPFYAAVFALINEQRAKNGKDPVGWINQWLYEQAPTQDMFNDVTQGDNRPKATFDESTQKFRPVKTSLGYDAGRGFDACTGWGSPKGRGFFDTLVQK